MSEWMGRLPLEIVLLFLKSGLVLGVAALLTRRLTTASTRHAVWSTSFATVLAMPLLGLPVTIELPVGMRQLRIASLSDDSGSIVAPREAADAQAASRVSTARPRVASEPAPAGPEAPPAGPFAWIALVYLLGACVVATRVGLGMARAYRLVRGSHPLDPDGAWAASLPAPGLGAAPRARLRTTDAIRTPLTVGIVRPTVLLPTVGADWSASHRRSALVHELAHVRRRDCTTQLIGSIACVVYWLNPLAWLGARRLHLEAERACDEHVVRSGADPHDYARQLVQLTRSRMPAMDGAIGIVGRSELAARVASILTCEEMSMKSHRAQRACAAALIATVALSVAPFAPGDGTSAARSRGTSTPMSDAVLAGDIARVESLIESGADVNRCTTPRERDGVLRTLLATAARAGHRDVVEVLLDAGAEIDAAPEGDATALMEAAAHGHEDVVALLIARGADVDRRIPGDGTPLISAARGGGLSIVRQLVRAGADVNVGISGDGNPLISAVRNDDVEMVKFLLETGADPRAHVPGDESALVAGAESGDAEILRMLVDAVDVR